MLSLWYVGVSLQFVSVGLIIIIIIIILFLR
jgi:hypothetical protein